ncbi:hypothetical protein [Sphingobium sp. B11D3D]|uniref:hypothetical protein n=1 Tax=Sphingobium sp. B11D3D TaxID=2940576 RepID=UPI0022257F3E|nr:hypothetical protein [Sphingobium sp. B11D3D]MCW2368936.1 hypothetical protein [Sphingobium sp. B11D3D]
MTAAPIDLARKAAAQHLRESGFADEAQRVATGEGDDFMEVRLALALLKILQPESGPPVRRNGRRLVGEEC